MFAENVKENNFHKPVERHNSHKSQKQLATRKFTLPKKQFKTQKTISSDIEVAVNNVDSPI